MTKIQVRFLSIILISLSSISCAKKITTGSTQGNAEGYNGGDTSDLSLRAARGTLLAGIRTLREDGRIEMACNPRACRRADKSGKWCVVLDQLNLQQSQSCSAFVRGTVGLMLELDVPLRMSDRSLEVAHHGQRRRVDAVTELGAAGEILFDEVSVRTLSADDLLAVLFHEYGHKLQYEGRFIDDELPIGGFEDGRKFLDTAAVAFVALLRSVNPPGVVDPEPENNVAVGSGPTAPSLDVLPNAPTTTLYRSFDRGNNSYFYTSDFAEHQYKIQHGHRDESGLAIKVYSENFFGAMPIYRLEHPQTLDHMYVNKIGAKDAAVALGWRFERIEGYIMRNVRPGGVEILTLQNTNNQSLYFTVSITERDALIRAQPNRWISYSSFGFGAP